MSCMLSWEGPGSQLTPGELFSAPVSSIFVANYDVITSMSNPTMYNVGRFENTAYCITTKLRVMRNGAATEWCPKILGILYVLRTTNLI